MAAHQKKTRDLNATLVFTDESGFFLAPLARRTLARQGRTPVLHPLGRYRARVSVAGALTLSPIRGRLGLYYQTYPNAVVDSELYGYFLSNLLWHLRGNVVLLHDGGTIHNAPAIQAVCNRFPRLHLHTFPPYAPELNPPEALWNYVKYHRLGNFVPRDIAHVEATVCAELDAVRHDQDRLRTFFGATPLPWSNTTLLF